jgi:PKD repeat protein
MLWQQDDNPGTAVDAAPYTDPVHTNYMLYNGWDPARFEPYAPTVDFSYTLTAAGPSFNATFTNLSMDAETYLWEFGDGGTSTLTNPTHVYAEGVYEVCLTGYNVYGSATTCQEIVAVTPPTALFDFSGDPTVTFTDLSLNEPTSWDWDFDDGGTSTLENPVHTYAFNGIYNVCLTVTNAGGSNTFCQNVFVTSYAAPLANFTYSGDPTVTFTDLTTGDPTGWSWTFGDAGTSTEQNPVHTYATNGTYNVCLTATNALGTSTSCQDVTIGSYLAPTVIFSHAGDPTVTFTDLSTEDPTSWSWDFGDGSFSTEQNPVYTYAANGTYNVCLTATNDIGSNTGCEAVVIASFAAPEALFTHTGDPDVSFTNLTVDATLWFWNFDDGAFSSEENPVHSYTANGTYNVCLEATGPGGTDVYCEDVVVGAVVITPVADFDFFFGVGGSVSFFDNSTNAPTTWAWDFGDGGTSTEQDPVHVFTEGGTFNVCLTAGNAGGSDNVCKVVDVTGINDIQTLTLNAWPNPATASISVTLPEAMGNDLQMVILNTVGQKVILSNMTSLPNQTLQIDVQELAAGAYSIYLSDGTATYVARFVKE